MNKLMFTLGLVLLGINIAGVLVWIGVQAIDTGNVQSGDFFLPMFIIYNIGLLFMVVFGAFQK